MSDDTDKPLADEPREATTPAPVSQPASEPTAESPSPETPAQPRILTDLEGPKTLRDEVIEALKTIYDPEIPVNIYEMGLIYGVDLDEDARRVQIRMTLTSPACPVAGSLPGEVETRVAALDGIDAAEVELVWDPPWSKDMLSEEALLQLGLL